LKEAAPSMGFYSRVIFPWLCDRGMRDPKLTRFRKELLADVHGEVLEIGFGTGLNLEHYPEQVGRLAAVDPGIEIGRLARRRIEQSRIEVDQTVSTAEELPFADQRFDHVVSTWTLCSIPQVGRAVAEVYRVLKPGGRFVFLEHGISDDERIQKWQRRLNGLQRRLAGGCRLDLDVKAVIGEQPFEILRMDQFLLPKTPRTHGTMYRGVAVK
jgi:ubiquinone/menaquinone biosynthesis C-methylase UbiE